MARVWFTILLALVALNLTEGVVCPDKFVLLGNFCYHFTDVEEDWIGGRGVCEGIGIFQDEDIILGVLDYGFSTNDNQLLLTHAFNSGDTYWLGGYNDEDSDIWRWIEHNNREINLHANYWYDDHPTTEGHCLMITKSSYRSYVKAVDCTQRSKVICQIIPEEIGFRIIGEDAFYFSAENNIATESTWQGARDFCQSIQPPNDFDQVDLAVLGRNHELDQDILQVIAHHGKNTWLGGQHIGGDYTGTFSWIDGRSLEDTFYFWYSQQSTANEDYYYDYYTYAWVTSANGHARSRLRVDANGDSVLNFVCQAFKSTTH